MAARTDLIHCELCGEDYSITYRKCPFCNGRGDLLWEDDYIPESEEYGGAAPSAPRSRGRRAGGNTRGGGYGQPRHILRIVLFLLSLALVFAAGWIMIRVALPFLFPKQPVDPGENSVPPITSPIDSSPSVSVPPVSPGPSEETPAESDPVDEPPEESDEPSPSPRPSTGGLRLNRADFTLDRSSPAFRITASGVTGTVTWSSSRPEVATVSDSGLVTAVGPGNTNITATDESGAKVTCIVRVPSGFTSAAPSESVPPATVSDPPTKTADPTDVTLSHSDVTLSDAFGLSFTLRLKGTTDTATWSSSNTSVATVTAGGVVTGVATGTCTITATLPDGTTLKCLIRVSR